MLRAMREIFGKDKSEDEPFLQVAAEAVLPDKVAEAVLPAAAEVAEAAAEDGVPAAAEAAVAKAVLSVLPEESSDDEHMPLTPPPSPHISTRIEVDPLSRWVVTTDMAADDDSLEDAEARAEASHMEAVRSLPEHVLKRARYLRMKTSCQKVLDGELADERSAMRRVAMPALDAFEGCVAATYKDHIRMTRYPIEKSI